MTKSKLVAFTGLVLAGMLMQAHAQLNVNGKKVNASQGYTYQGTAPVNHVLLGNGTLYVDGVLPTYNFSPRFSVTGTTPNFSVDLAGAGTPGTYASPSSVTVDAYGRVTAITSSSAVSRTCSSGVCYKVAADGTIEVWGASSASFNGATNGTGSVTFPAGVTFTTTPTIAGLVITQQPNGNNDAITAVVSSKTTTGFNFYLRCSTNIGGSGCSNFTGTVSVDFNVRGY